MKRIIFFFCVIIFLKGQGNAPLGLPNGNEVRWRVAYWGGQVWSYHPTIPGIYDFVLKTDTVINGKIYKRLYFHLVRKGTVPSPFLLGWGTSVDTGYIGALHYDTTSKKLIFWSRFGNSFWTLWDLDSLNYGKFQLRRLDAPVTVLVENGSAGYCLNQHTMHTCVIDSVDTVNILGVQRRRFHIRTKGQQDISHCAEYKDGWFIEGIGHETGIFSNAYVGPWDTTWRVGYDISYNYNPCDAYWEDIVTPFSKLLCITVDSMQHEFVPGGCELTPTVKRPNYVPFPEDSGAVWVIRYNNITFSIYRTGKKFFEDGKWKVPVNNMAYWQDTTNRKVWIKYPKEKDSLLLCSFDANLGHFVDMVSMANSYKVVSYGGNTMYDSYAIFGWLSEVDSIVIGNETRRVYKYRIARPDTIIADSIRYDYTYDDSVFIFVEGIGFLDDPFGREFRIGDYIGVIGYGYPNDRAFCPTSLNLTYGEQIIKKKSFVCFKYKDFEYIVDTLGCKLATGIVRNEDLKPEIKILNDRIIIDMLGKQLITGIEVYNLLGQAEIKNFQTLGTQYELNIGDLPRGIHILKITAKNGVFTRKFYKN